MTKACVQYRVLSSPPEYSGYSKYERSDYLNIPKKEMELQHIGNRCDICNRLDFVPMICSLCKGVFCEHHGSLESHKCVSTFFFYLRLATKLNATTHPQPHMMDGDVRTVKCPDCGVYIPCTKENKDIRLAEHIQSGCVKHAKKVKKVRCSLAKCKTRLEKYESFNCRDCKNVFCVKHRTNHKCGNSTVLRSFKRMKKIREKQIEISKNGAAMFGSAIRRGHPAPALHNLPSWKKQKVVEMTNLLQCTPERAVTCLNRGRWNLDRAITFYYGS